MESQEKNVQNESSEAKPTEIEFGNIALSLSGGGYRAAAFHLGSLDLLFRLGLLDKVTMLSTVSGGTITGAKYVLSLSQKDPQTNEETFFQNFYQELYNFFLNEPLPDIWIEKLDQQNDSSQEQPRLISAVAATYQELFQDIKFAEIIGAKSKLHLKEIIFNTTELRTGIGFRFRIGSGRIGHGRISIPESILKEVALADVVAASSCFPIGFEPMYFPDDFFKTESWQEILSKNVGNQKYRESLRKRFANSLPLMDGGIYDNLGVSAIILADKRIQDKAEKAEKKADLRGKEEILKDKIGTFIISDTDNLGLEETFLKKIDPKLPIPNFLAKLTLKKTKNIIQFLFYLSLLITVSYIIYFVYLVWNIDSITIEKIVNLILISLATGIFWTVKIIFKNLSKLLIDLSSPSSMFESNQAENSEEGKNIITFLRDIILDWDNFMQTIGDFTLAEAYSLFVLRLQSVPAILLAFLKGQRGRNYDLSFNIYKNNVIPNYIFDVNPRSKNTSLEMKEIALKATGTSTTLWLDSNPEKAKEQLNDLIACGQFTLCYKLKKHIEKMENIATKENISLSIETVEIKRKVERIWQELMKNPYSLIR